MLETPQFTPPPPSDLEINRKLIEESANFEGNWAEALFDRLHNPVIREQLIDLYYKEQLIRQEYFRTEPFVLDLTMADGTNIYKDRSGKQVMEKTIRSFVLKTKEEIGRELDERVAEEMKVTPVEFSDKFPTSESIGLYWINPHTKDTPTLQQKSLMEAHEKGHRIRSFHKEFGWQFFQDHFAVGFDKSKVVFTEKDMDIARAVESAKGEDADLSMAPEQVKEYHMEYLFSPNEIVERMSQLKNYFGMRGDEQFTHEHLEYARRHYVEDVGLDNSITHFFQSITPETEERFLWLINNSGV